MEFIQASRARGETLDAEDAAWLHMDSAKSPMVVNTVIELAGHLPLDRARDLVDRLAQIPRFRAVVAEPEHASTRPRWERARDFDSSNHLERVELTGPGDGELRAFIGGAVSRTLDPARPLFFLHVIDRPGVGTTLLFRVHHAIADGFALLGLLSSLCDEERALGEQPAVLHPAVAMPTIRGAAAAVRHLVTLPDDPKTSLRGALSAEKRVAWSEPIALDDVRDIAHATRATVNDVLVAIVAGALGRYFESRREPTPISELHAMVPVNLRANLRGALASAPVGNHFGLVVLGLPIGIRDPIARVAAAKKRMDRLKGTPEAIVAHEVLRVLGRAPRKLEDVVVDFFAKKTSLVLTNVPGPRVRLKLLGVPIARIVFWVPQAGRLSLGISVFSYAREVTIGVIADAARMEDPAALVRAARAELDLLREAIGANGSKRLARAVLHKASNERSSS